jgi:hypothetical protein
MPLYGKPPRGGVFLLKETDMATIEVRNRDYRTPSQFGENWFPGVLVGALPILILIFVFTRKK